MRDANEVTDILFESYFFVLVMRVQTGVYVIGSLRKIARIIFVITKKSKIIIKRQIVKVSCIIYLPDKIRDFGIKGKTKFINFS